MENQLTPNEAEFLKVREEYLKEIEENPLYRSIGMRLEQLSIKIPNKKGLLFEDKSWTWKEINEESNKIANYFLSLGIKPGEIIGVMMENSPEFTFIMGGLNKIQAISALINVNLRKKPLIHVVSISEPKFIIVDGECLPAIQDIMDDINLTNDSIYVINNNYENKHNFLELQNKLHSISKENPQTTNDSKLLDHGYFIYTSGTTGFPKAVMIRNLTTGQFYAQCMRLTEEDIVYDPLPLYHSHSNVTWKSVAWSGATLALKKRFSASDYWKDIKKFGANTTVYIGELPRYLLNRPESEYVRGSLKKMFGLGLRKDIWEPFKTRFNIEHIWEFYGGTDFGVPFFNVDEIPGMVGRLYFPNIEIAKVDETTGEFFKDENDFCIKCQKDEIGMVMVKIEYSENYALYKNKESTMRKIIFNAFEENDAYLKTGDLVQLHENNWVSFADRFGDTFRWKGENVSTLEVESVLNTFPAVEICNVFGIAIPNSDGKAGMVAVQLYKEYEFDPELISKFVKENLPPYAIPVFLRLKDELEFTGTHKLRKVNLKKEGFDLEKIKDKIYYWDTSVKRYKYFDQISYKDLLNGKLVF